jgi:uncharacterized membrane protein
MGEDSKTSRGRNGCMNALTFVVFMALVAWAAFGYEPREAVAVALAVWACGVVLLLGTIVGMAAVGALADWLKAR